MKALTRTRREIETAWQSFVADGRLADSVRPEIRRSWARVRSGGHVDPRLATCPRALRTEEALARVGSDDVARVASRVLAPFADRLAAGGHVIAFFDAGGVLLTLDGNGRTRGRLEDVNFAPGACWAEGSAGTNGPGTSLVEGRPVEVFAAEHYVEAWQAWTCASAPVRVGGRLFGAVDVTSPWTAREPSLLLTAEALAQAIGARLEADLATAQQALLVEVARDALRARDDFLSSASHELKTPLTPLRFKLQAAQRLLARAGDGVEADHLEQVLRGADAHVGRLVRAIDRLLDASRGVDEPLRPMPEPFELGGAVRGLVEGQRAELERCGCQVTVAASREVVGRWDPALVAEAVGHLLRNAVAYAPGRIEVEVDADRARARVVVRDRGPGIAPEDRERIFEPYERAVSCRNVAGFGLGLHVVRRNVHAHGGTVRVESAPGAGSAFVVELPLAGPAPEDAAWVLAAPP